MASKDHARQGDQPGAGASAQREHQRRKAARERRVRERHPRIGELLLAVQGEPQHETAWRTGGEGEAAVAELLARRCGERIAVLHDRRIPGRRANIDHIVVAASGVYVIDTKRYRGRIEVTRPWFGEAKLKIAGRDRTNLVAGLAGQVELVAARVAAVHDDVVVRGALCFVAPDGALSDSGLPLLRTLRVGGVELLYPRALAERLNAQGPHAPERILALAGELERHFPAA
jgi:hypothetical protein